jgi:hypothetical protein
MRRFPECRAAAPDRGDALDQLLEETLFEILRRLGNEDGDPLRYVEAYRGLPLE